MKKALLITALCFASLSVFFQYKAISFAMNITELVREFGRKLANGEDTQKLTDFFFLQAEEIRLNTQDSFIAQQISIGLLTGAIICIVLGLILDKKKVATAE